MTAHSYLEEQLGEELSECGLSAILARDYLERFAQIKVKEALELAAKRATTIEDYIFASLPSSNANKGRVDKKSITSVINLIEW